MKYAHLRALHVTFLLSEGHARTAARFALLKEGARLGLSFAGLALVLHGERS